MATGIYDFLCAECGNAFEAILRSSGEAPHCPRCASVRVARRPVMQMFTRTRRGRTVDLSSNLCPCGCAGRRHARSA